MHVHVVVVEFEWQTKQGGRAAAGGLGESVRILWENPYTLHSAHKIDCKIQRPTWGGAITRRRRGVECQE